MTTMKRVKKIIKRNFFGQLFISIYHEIQCATLPKLISDEKAVKHYYKRLTGKELNLANPKTFSEKVNWYKLNDRNPLMMICADKYAVREYIEEKGYGHTLNELYGVYNNVKEIDISKLPDKFVMKASHGSHMIVIVNGNKASINWKKQRMLMSSWLRQDIYWSGREWVYKNIPRRIIAERYLEDLSGSLWDYKIYCFHGVPRYIDVDVDRHTKHFRNFYDLNWNFIPMSSCVPNNPDVIIDKPDNYDEMIKMAKDLSAPFQFVRVDLYNIKGKIYFGELTFFQDGGNPGYSEKYDSLIGQYWTIETKHLSD